jgi:hypothetical protein
MLKLPILGSTYNLILVKPEQMSEQLRKQNVGGLCNKDDKVIFVDATREDVLHIARHEILHAFEFESEVDLNNMNDESIIDWFAYHYNSIHQAYIIAGLV